MLRGWFAGGHSHRPREVRHRNANLPPQKRGLQTAGAKGRRPPRSPIQVTKKTPPQQPLDPLVTSSGGAEPGPAVLD